MKKNGVKKVVKKEHTYTCLNVQQNVSVPPLLNYFKHTYHVLKMYAETLRSTKDTFPKMYFHEGDVERNFQNLHLNSFTL